MRILNWAAIVGSGLLLAAAEAGAQPIHENLGDGVTRSFASAADRLNAEPSVALIADPPSLGPAPVGSGPRPDFFDLGPAGSVVLVPVEPGTNLYGTGMQSGPLERSGRRVQFYNFDNFGWGDNSDRNYQTHPWVLGVHEDGRAFGVLFDATWRSVLDLSRPDDLGILFETRGPAPRVITIEAASPQAVVRKLAELTGLPFMPPMWSVGYHQSRFSYVPQDAALAIAEEFRAREIPAEVLWLDIDYMDGFRNFTVDASLFPDPALLNAQLDDIGFQAVWMANAGIKLEDGYDVYDEMRDLGLAVQNAAGQPFVGEVWPGLSVWPDFTMAATRDWWAGRVAEFAQMGIDGIWNDMNEPAVFNVASRTMPDDNHHRADAELGGPGPHLRYHNIYGMQMSRATREGMRRAFPDRRPFVLTRAGYIGGQRYAAMWTGDNNANWYHVNVSIQNILNMGLSGQPNAGPDIGGFNGDSGARMYARWMGLGAMMPFARGHYGFSGRDREPWSYGEATEDTSRRALNRRYRLLNYLYTQFHTAHTTGLPVARPLFFAEPDNPRLRFYDDGFLVGPGLFVAGATWPGATPQLPPKQTPIFRFAYPESSDPAAPLDSLDPDLPALFVLGGHIVIANELVQHSRELTPRRDEALELIIGLDEQGYAEGVLYEDDGDGFAYSSGAFRRTTFAARSDGPLVTVSVDRVEGDLPFVDRPVTIRVLLGDEREFRLTTMLSSLPAAISIPPVEPEPQPDPASRDGRLVGERFDPTGPLATNTADRFSEISQLRALFARAGDQGLEIGIEGELATDGTAAAIFVDARAGGQNRLTTTAVQPPPAGIAPLTGTRFDEGFNPDHILFINGFDGSVFVDWVTLDADGFGRKIYQGRQFIGSGASTLADGTNTTGAEVALGSAGPAAGSGFEILIPWNAIGRGNGLLNEVKLFAAVVKPWGELTNQLLPQVTNDWIGFSPNFQDLPGEQFVRVLAEPDLTGDDKWDVLDLIEYLRLVDKNDPAADIAAPLGTLDAADVRAVIQATANE